MDAWICLNCCLEYPSAPRPPESCPVCCDERVITPLEQRWIASSELARGHRTELRPLEDGITSVGVTPKVGIAQQAILVELEAGCILWDCVPVLDEPAAAYVRARGGLEAVALSHPHFYGAMAAWAEAFDAPILVHEKDRAWVTGPAAARTQFWDGASYALGGGATLVHCGGHFEGACVLHAARTADGAGALLAGDTVMVLPNQLGAAFMRSYPRYVPLSLAAVDRIAERLAPYAFERVYGAWFERVIPREGKATIERAVRRYKDALAA